MRRNACLAWSRRSSTATKRSAGPSAARGLFGRGGIDVGKQNNVMIVGEPVRRSPRPMSPAAPVTIATDCVIAAVLSGMDSSVPQQLAVIAVAVGHELLFDAAKRHRRLRLDGVGDQAGQDIDGCQIGDARRGRAGRCCCLPARSIGTTISAALRDGAVGLCQARWS